MTIAGVYLSPEGVVFGADSTSSVSSNQGYHFFDFNQKLFEIGEGSTLGILTWGLMELTAVSYRTLIASFSDDLAKAPAATFTDVMQRWIDKFWQDYSADNQITRFNTLAQKMPYGQSPNAQGVRTQEEENEYALLQSNLAVGFCIAGYVSQDRTPCAQHVIFAPGMPKPTPQVIQQHNITWWGIPNFFTRLLYGADDQLLNAIQNSGKWQGTMPDLQQIALSNAIVPTCTLPIRDAVDYVHTCIYCTIKAIKFSGIPQVCGGPIELAVITSDRKFRWVRHKTWDAAILDGGT